MAAGAFSKKENATQLERRLIRMFTVKQVHSEFEADKNIYRIRIGPIASIDVADKLSSILKNKGISTKKVTLD